MQLLGHMLPVLSPLFVYLLKLWVGHLQQVPPKPADIKLSMAWSLLSVCIWMLTVQWAQKNLVLCCGRLPGKIRPKFFDWERLGAFLVFAFVVITCGATSSPSAAGPVFAVCSGILAATGLYLMVGYVVVTFDLFGIEPQTI